jgi:hypothetical protein
VRRRDARILQAIFIAQELSMSNLSGGGKMESPPKTA